MPSISTPTLAPPNRPRLADRPDLARPSKVGPPCHSVATSNETGAPTPSSPGVSSARRPAMVPWIAAAPSVASRNAARTAAAVSAWIRWLTSGHARAGSIRSISSWSSRWSARIRAWNANPVRVRRDANSSSRRTDQEASAAARVARRPRTSRRSLVRRAPAAGSSSTAASAAGDSRSWSRAGRTWARALARDAARARPTTSSARAAAKRG